MDETPLDEALNMRKKGLNKKDIADDLKNQGYKPTQVSDAMNQLDIKNQVDDKELNSMQPSILDQEIPVPEPPKEYEESKREIVQKVQVQQPYQQTLRPQTMPTFHTSQEELIESIVDEKWQQIIDTVGDIEIWKARLNDDLTSIKQEILRLSGRLDNIQRSVVGKVTEYNQNIIEVETEIKALEKVMQNIIQPLTSNIKELARITKDLKKGKS